MMRSIFVLVVVSICHLIGSDKTLVLSDPLRLTAEIRAEAKTFTTADKKKALDELDARLRDGNNPLMVPTMAQIIETDQVETVGRMLLEKIRIPPTDPESVEAFILSRARRLLGHRIRFLVPELIPLLDSPDEAVWSEAIWTLGSIGPGAKEALPRIQKEIGSPDLTRAGTAISVALSITGRLDAPSLAGLARLLDSDDFQHAWTSLSIMTKSGKDPAMIFLLPKMCRHAVQVSAQQEEVRIRAAEQLVHQYTELLRDYGDPGLIALANHLNTHSTIELELTCLRAFDETGRIMPSPDLIEAMTNLRKHPRAEVQAAASEALARWQPKSPVSLNAAESGNASDVGGGHPDESKLRRVLADNDREQIVAALEILVEDENLAGALIERVKTLSMEMDPEIRRLCAIIQYQNKPGDVHLKTLLDLIPNPDMSVSQGAAEFLWKQGEELDAVMSHLVKITDMTSKARPNRSSVDAIELLLLLASHREQAASPLLSVLDRLDESPDLRVRFYSGMARFWIGKDSSQALKAIRTSLETPESSHKLAVGEVFRRQRELGDIGRDAREAVERYYQNPRSKHRLEAALWLDEFTSDSHRVLNDFCFFAIRTEPMVNHRTWNSVRAMAEIPPELVAELVEQLQLYADFRRQGEIALVLAERELARSDLEQALPRLLETPGSQTDAAFAQLVVDPQHARAREIAGALDTRQWKRVLEIMTQSGTATKSISRFLTTVSEDTTMSQDIRQLAQTTLESPPSSSGSKGKTVRPPDVRAWFFSRD